MLDNFEHVLPAAPLVSDLMAHCPRLKVLVTSRVLLRVTGEYALPVPPLTLPDVGGHVPIDALMRSEAVQLFAQRGKAVSPSFDVSEGNAPLWRTSAGGWTACPGDRAAAARVTHSVVADPAGAVERRLPLLTGGGAIDHCACKRCEMRSPGATTSRSGGASPLPAVGGVCRRLHPGSG